MDEAFFLGIIFFHACCRALKLAALARDVETKAQWRVCAKAQNSWVTGLPLLWEDGELLWWCNTRKMSTVKGDYLWQCPLKFRSEEKSFFWLWDTEFVGSLREVLTVWEDLMRQMGRWEHWSNSWVHSDRVLLGNESSTNPHPLNLAAWG